MRRVYAARRGGQTTGRMFVFFSNRLGCLGSLAVSLVLSLVLYAILRLLA